MFSAPRLKVKHHYFGHHSSFHVEKTALDGPNPAAAAVHKHPAIFCVAKRCVWRNPELSGKSHYKNQIFAPAIFISGFSTTSLKKGIIRPCSGCLGNSPFPVSSPLPRCLCLVLDVVLTVTGCLHGKQVRIGCVTGCFRTGQFSLSENTDMTQNLLRASLSISFTLGYQTNPLMVVHSHELVRSFNFFVTNGTCTQKNRLHRAS